MENLNAEKVINELDCQTRFAKFSNSNGVLISVKCAQFVLDHVQYYEQRIKELTEEVAEEKAKGEMCAEVIKRQDKEIAQKDAEIKRLRESYEIVAKLWAKDRAAKTIQKGE